MTTAEVNWLRHSNTSALVADVYARAVRQRGGEPERVTLGDVLAALDASRREDGGHDDGQLYAAVLRQWSRDTWRELPPVSGRAEPKPRAVACSHAEMVAAVPSRIVWSCIGGVLGSEPSRPFAPSTARTQTVHVGRASAEHQRRRFSLGGESPSRVRPEKAPPAATPRSSPALARTSALQRRQSQAPARVAARQSAAEAEARARRAALEAEGTAAEEEACRAGDALIATAARSLWLQSKLRRHTRAWLGAARAARHARALAWARAAARWRAWRRAHGSVLRHEAAAADVAADAQRTRNVLHRALSRLRAHRAARHRRTAWLVVSTAVGSARGGAFAAAALLWAEAAGAGEMRVAHAAQAAAASRAAALRHTAAGPLRAWRRTAAAARADVTAVTEAAACTVARARMRRALNRLIGEAAASASARMAHLARRRFLLRRGARKWARRAAAWDTRHALTARAGGRRAGALRRWRRRVARALSRASVPHTAGPASSRLAAVAHARAGLSRGLRSLARAAIAALRLLRAQAALAARRRSGALARWRRACAVPVLRAALRRLRRRARAALTRLVSRPATARAHAHATAAAARRHAARVRARHFDAWLRLVARSRSAVALLLRAWARLLRAAFGAWAGARGAAAWRREARIASHPWPHATPVPGATGDGSHSPSGGDGSDSPRAARGRRSGRDRSRHRSEQQPAERGLFSTPARHGSSPRLEAATVAPTGSAARARTPIGGARRQRRQQASQGPDSDSHADDGGRRPRRKQSRNGSSASGSGRLWSATASSDSAYLFADVGGVSAQDHARVLPSTAARIAIRGMAQAAL